MQHADTLYKSELSLNQNTSIMDQYTFSHLESAHINSLAPRPSSYFGFGGPGTGT